MTEAGGDAATYLPVLAHKNSLDEWASECADILKSVLARSPTEREQAKNAGLLHVASFSEDQAIERYLDIYREILEQTPA